MPCSTEFIDFTMKENALEAVVRVGPQGTPPLIRLDQ